MAVTLEELRDKHREFILSTAERCGVSDVRIFGSVLHGAAQEDSDLDLLVEVRRGTGLMELVGWQLDLEDRIGVPVQIVTQRSVSPLLQQRILSEAQPL